MDEPILPPQETDEDRVLNLSLRPTALDDFIGQTELVENLRVAVQAAKARGEPLEHLLFSGPPGLGKTTLAHIIAHECGAKITATSGPAIARPGDLVGTLTNLEVGDVLFIDEIHRLSKAVEEYLYQAMEDFRIDFTIDTGPYAKTVKFSLKPFILIGATTRSGLLSAPLRSRFGMAFHLNFYETDDLVKVVTRSAAILNVDLEGGAALEIARRSRGTPRIANRLLRRARDYAQVKADGRITNTVAVQALTAQGIDPLGLDDADRKVLRTIIDVYQGGPVGIEALAATINEEADTVTDVIEPYLLKAGLLKRTPRGREITRAVYDHFQMAPRANHGELFPEPA